MPSAEPASEFRVLAARRKRSSLPGRASRRAVLHLHEQGGEEFPHRDGPGRRSEPEELAGTSSTIRKTCCSSGRDLQGLRGRDGKVEGAELAFAFTISAQANGTSMEFPEPVYTASFELHAGIRRADAFRYSYQSLVTPPSVFDYDMTTRQADARRSSRKCSAVTIPAIRRPSACGPRPATAPRCRSRSSTRRASSATAGTRSCSTATALTASACRPSFSQRPAEPARSRHGCSPSPTFAAATRWARRGTTTAS